MNTQAKSVKQVKKVMKYYLYCFVCNCETPHTLTVDGDWEIYTCQEPRWDDDDIVLSPCGEQQRYRVR